MSPLPLRIGRDDEGHVVLKSPGVGYWRGVPKVGTILTAGQEAGVLCTLGRDRALVVPKEGQGVVLATPSGTSGDAIAYGDTLLVLGEAGSMSEVAEASEGANGSQSGGAMTFCSSSSGRFYVRPAPDKPAFVAVGDIVEAGQTVYLLEVMKTFSRVTYGGEGLPERAKVARIVPADGDDLEAGQVVLELEPVES